MSIMQMFIELAERTPQPEPVYWVEERPLCAKCRWHEVAMPEDLCEQCAREEAQGYEVLSMTGRCANGAQRDSGTRYHAVRFGEYKAVCGTTHGRRSRWSEYHGDAVTCPRCIKKLERKSL